MRRDPALVSLSRDHHQALAVARKLRRATTETALEARADVLLFWRTDGRTHFRIEEEVLLPAYAGYGDAHHPLVARALCEHVAIRHAIDELAADATPSVACLHELGNMLAEHVRMEERELFVLVEQALPPSRLAALAAALAQAGERSSDG